MERDRRKEEEQGQRTGPRVSDTEQAAGYDGLMQGGRLKTQLDVPFHFSSLVIRVHRSQRDRYPPVRFRKLAEPDLPLVHRGRS